MHATCDNSVKDWDKSATGLLKNDTCNSFSDESYCAANEKRL